MSCGSRSLQRMELAVCRFPFWCVPNPSQASSGPGRPVWSRALHRNRCEIKDGPVQGEREYNHPGEAAVGNYSYRLFLPRRTASHRGSGSWACDLGQVVCFWELCLPVRPLVPGSSVSPRRACRSRTPTQAHYARPGEMREPRTWPHAERPAPRAAPPGEPRALISAGHTHGVPRHRGLSAGLPAGTVLVCGAGDSPGGVFELHAGPRGQAGFPPPSC